MSKKKYETHSHFECAKAKLMRWGNDPIVAECSRNGERHVASTIIACPSFEKRMREPIIEQRKKRNE